MASSKLAVPCSSSGSSTSGVDKLEKIGVEAEDKKCVLCKRSTVDEANLGALYSRSDVIAHYYCLLLCSNLAQKGEDEDGIMGFLTDDIQAEVQRVHKKNWMKFYRCRFCQETGATIGCCVKACKMIFHFPCGLENAASFDFTDFSSYCERHTKKFPPQWKINLSENGNCRICGESLKMKPIAPVKVMMGKQRVVLGSCCRPSMFHKECIQAYALNAGCFFKCPTCADEKAFRKDAEEQCIFIPERDASWESEPNAYVALKKKYSTCDATTCVCPSGRDRSDKERGSMYYLKRCYDCAASATHIGCSPSPLTPYDKWVCSFCSTVKPKSTSEHLEMAEGSSPSASEEGSDEDDDVNLSSVSSELSSSSNDSMFTVIRTKNKRQCSETERQKNEVGTNSSSSNDSDSSLFEPTPTKKRRTSIPETAKRKQKQPLLIYID